MRTNVALQPAGKGFVFGFSSNEFSRFISEVCIGRVNKVLLHTLNFSLNQLAFTVTETRPFFVDQFLHALHAQCFHQNLDTGLVFVVAATELVVHTDDGIQVGQQVGFRQEAVDLFTQNRGTTQTTTNQYAETDLASIVLNDVQTDVMHGNRRTVMSRHGIHSDLELTRQEGKFRMEGRPLTDDLAVRARINQFFRNHTRVLVSGGVTDTVTTGLHGVHLHFSQVSQNLRHVFQGRPVELHVLTG